MWLAHRDGGVTRLESGERGESRLQVRPCRLPTCSWGTDKAPHAGVAPESGELNSDLYFLLMACSSPHHGPGGTAAWAGREEPPAAPPHAMPPPLAVLGGKRRCPPPLPATPLLTQAGGPGRQSPGEGVRLCHFSEDSVN